jgi:uncharacterized protein YcbK (DUF882 family)
MMIFPKGSNARITKDFKALEFDCVCHRCDETHIELDLVVKLQLIRNETGKPVVIRSGYRCEAHNDELIKEGYPAVKNSTHMRGAAADIQVEGMSGEELEKVASQKGFKAIGVAENWVHLDIRTDKERRWRYA